MARPRVMRFRRGLSMKAVAAFDVTHIGTGESIISFSHAREGRAHFEELPLLIEGESKIVRQINEELVIIKLKPTLFSYSANRTAVVEGTDELRLRISHVLWTELS